MRLGNFFRAATTCTPVNPLPVELNLLGVDLNNRMMIARKAKAVMVFVDEDTRENLRVAARKALAAKFPGQDYADVLSDEYSYQLLYQALRDADSGKVGQFEPFAESVDELRGALVVNEASRLMTAYKAYLDAEFPEVPPSDATFRGDGAGSEAASGSEAG